MAARSWKLFGSSLTFLVLLTTSAEVCPIISSISYRLIKIRIEAHTYGVLPDQLYLGIMQTDRLYTTLNSFYFSFQSVSPIGRHRSFFTFWFFFDLVYIQGTNHLSLLNNVNRWLAEICLSDDRHFSLLIIFLN